MFIYIGIACSSLSGSKWAFLDDRVLVVALAVAWRYLARTWCGLRGRVHFFGFSSVPSTGRSHEPEKEQNWKRYGASISSSPGLVAGHYACSASRAHRVVQPPAPLRVPHLSPSTPTSPSSQHQLAELRGETTMSYFSQMRAHRPAVHERAVGMPWRPLIRGFAARSPARSQLLVDAVRARSTCSCRSPSSPAHLRRPGRSPDAGRTGHIHDALNGVARHRARAVGFMEHQAAWTNVVVLQRQLGHRSRIRRPHQPALIVLLLCIPSPSLRLRQDGGLAAPGHCGARAMVALFASGWLHGLREHSEPRCGCGRSTSRRATHARRFASATLERLFASRRR